jgi:cytidine deaminase
MWILLQNIYRNLTIQVKWDSLTSEKFCVQRGTMQGAKLSTKLHKVCHNSLLEIVENSGLGANIGNIRVPTTTCADDTAIIATSTHQLQAILEQAPSNRTCNIFMRICRVRWLS